LLLFGKDAERNKGLSGKVWKPDVDKRNHNRSGKGTKVEAKV
jgi:hypothetical protein